MNSTPKTIESAKKAAATCKARCLNTITKHGVRTVDITPAYRRWLRTLELEGLIKYKNELWWKVDKWTTQNTTLESWFERDRQYVGLEDKATEKTIIEWWDEAVSEAITDGFLNPKRWHESAVEYANQNNL